MLAEFAYFASSRHAIINDASSRASLFMNSVAAGTVALALIAQLSGLGEQFMLFALVILPTLLFLGVGTFRRLVDLNIEDAVHLVGMTRIRAFFHGANTALTRYDIFVGHDDLPSLAINAAQIEVQVRVSLWRVFITTPGTIATICGVIAGAMVAVLLNLPSIAPIGVLIGAVLAGGTMVLLLFYLQFSGIRRVFGAYRPRFPGPPRSIHPAFEDDATGS